MDVSIIFIEIMKERESITNLLVVASFLIGFILFFVSFWWLSKSQLLFKVGGVFFVTFLSLFADQAGVYSLAIFIIATFITKLDFLENIAALFWGRKEFWNYKILLAQANSNEIEDKLESEMKEDQAQKEGKSNENIFAQKPRILQRYAEFEQNVIEGLKAENIFLSLKPGIKLTYGTNEYIFDAVGSTFDCDYVIEIKMGETRSTLYRALHEIKQYLEVYEKYNSRRMFLKRNSRGLIVVPSNSEFDNIVDGVGVLKFDRQTKTFTNLNEIKNWID